MTFVSVLLDYPFLHTPRFELYAYALDGSAYHHGGWGGGYDLSGGIFAEAGLKAFKAGTLALTGSAHLYAGEWSQTPFTEDDPFRLTVQEYAVGVAHRWEWPTSPGVSTLAEYGVAAHAMIFLPTDAAGVLNPAVGGHTGGGFLFGSGKLRPVLRFDVAATLRTDRYDGFGQRPDWSYRWTYWPGIVRTSVLLGLQYR